MSLYNVSSMFWQERLISGNVDLQLTIISVVAPWHVSSNVDIKRHKYQVVQPSNHVNAPVIPSSNHS